MIQSARSGRRSARRKRQLGDGNLCAASGGQPRKIIIATILRRHGDTGGQTYANVLREYLASRGVDAPIVNSFSYLPLLALPLFAVRKIIEPLNGPFNVWWYRHWHYVFVLLALKRVLRKHRDVIVYAQCPLSAKAAKVAQRSKRQKVVMATHFNISQADEWVHKGELQEGDWVYHRIKNLERDVLPSLDGIVFVSRFMKETVERTLPAVRSIRSAVVPNFVSRPGTVQAPATVSDLISIGTLEPRKNQAYLLHVLAEAKRLGRCYSLTLVGDGPDRDRLEGLAHELGIGEQVRFLGYRKDAARLLHGHRAYVHSAQIENLPVAIIEAMACGLPVVAAPVGGIPELISDGVEGVYWSLADPAEGAKKLVELLGNEDLYDKLARAAEARFGACFDAEVVADRLVQFLCADRVPRPTEAEHRGP